MVHSYSLGSRNDVLEALLSSAIDHQQSLIESMTPLATWMPLSESAKIQIENANKSIQDFQLIVSTLN